MMQQEGQYQQQLAQESELWGAEAERMAQQIVPDWREHRRLRHNRLLHGERIEALLARVQPGMHTLELGCASGWLTLAMAQRGADATGLDISEPALEVARRYYQSIAAEVPGTAAYRHADLNRIELAADTYDIIAVKGTLHHLIEMPHVVEAIYQALKPGGLFWIHDTRDDENPRTVLAASALMFLLPTEVSYLDKIRGLLRFGFDAPSRIKASMEAEGLSPFEGAGRDHDWWTLVRERFDVESVQPMPAVTGYISAQLALPDSAAIPFLRLLRAADDVLVRLNILVPSMVTVYARK